VVFITGISWVINKFIGFDFEFRIEKTQFFSICLFLFFAILSIFAAADIIQGFRTLLQFFKLIIFYILFINLVDSEKKLKIVIYCLLAFMVISILYSLFQLYTGLGGSAIELLANRMRGLGGDPNIFAARIIFIIPFSFLMIFHSKSVWTKIFFAGILGVLIAGIAFSLSRGGALSLAVVILILLFMKRKIKLVWIFGLLMLIFIVIFLPGEFWERINSLSNINLGMSMRNRLRLAKSALTLFTENPFLGAGLGNFIVLSNKFVYIHQVAHNTFLEVAAETGIPGLCSFLLLIAAGFGNVMISKKRFLSAGKTFHALLSESVFVGFIGFLISSIFLSLETDFVFWTILSLGSVLFILSTQSTQSYDRKLNNSKTV